MIASRACLLFFALASARVFATEEVPFWKKLFRRNDWNDMSNYHGVADWNVAVKDVDWNSIDWSSVFGGKKDDSQPQQNPNTQPSSTPPAPSTAIVEENKTVQSGNSNSNSNTNSNEDDSKSNKNKDDSSSTNEEGSDGNSSQQGDEHKSSASCPDGCHMTISFTDNTLDVPFAAGNGGNPSTGNTKGTCICMSPGSVRVNIGVQETDKHTTLVEGNAAGLSDASFFDVSYVEGYNYPVTCWNADQPDLMSGSHIDLYEHGSCDDGASNQMGHICINPGYMKLATRDPAHDCMKCTLPSQFFAPAAGAAYTYPYDDCGCASGPHKDGPYKSPMATGGKLVCCVGPHCRPNTFSVPGQTAMGNCNRPDCKPCAGMGPTCSSSCNGSQSRKRDLEAVFEAAQAKERKHKRRHSHHHHHGAES